MAKASKRGPRRVPKPPLVPEEARNERRQVDFALRRDAEAPGPVSRADVRHPPMTETVVERFASLDRGARRRLA